MTRKGSGIHTDLTDEDTSRNGWSGEQNGDRTSPTRTPGFEGMFNHSLAEMVELAYLIPQNITKQLESAPRVSCWMRCLGQVFTVEVLLQIVIQFPQMTVYFRCCIASFGLLRRRW
jgi:hypothetical protein